MCIEPKQSKKRPFPCLPTHRLCKTIKPSPRPGGLARARLAAASIDEAPLEADLLVAHALGQDRLALYRDPHLPLTRSQAATLEALLVRRCAREPLPYLLGHREFYGLDFAVDPRVLIPRPETETLVEHALAWARARPPEADLTLADVGTGSGCIAVSLAVHLPQARLIATDLSPGALAVARANAQRHGAADRIAFRCGDLLEPLTEPVDAIVANLPYVAEDAAPTLAPEVCQHEPAEALFAGPDGLSLLRRCLATASPRLRPGGALFLEFSPLQRGPLVALAAQTFPDATREVGEDLAGLSRVLIVRT